MRKGVLLLVIVVIIVIFAIWFLFIRGPHPGQVKDEAQAAGRMESSMPGAADDYFHDMDYGISNHPDQVQAKLSPFIPNIAAEDAVQRFVIGRNNWIVWSGGNDRFWNKLNRVSFGTIDLLKTVSSYPKQPRNYPYGRYNRWEYLGLVNEPCFEQAKGPRSDRFGLWLDTRKPGCGDDPFEDEKRYPGVKFGARGKTVPVGSYYGYASGVVGLRLFPNPDFDEKAAKRWDPVRYYTDPTYYNDAKLVRPLRVGMSCGFCHVGPNPSNPPKNPEEPEWANLNSNPGAQYFWVDRIFVWNPDQKNFFYQLFHTSQPGALDTSFVSSDQLNNPRTMNAVYELPARLEMALKWGDEEMAGAELHNKQFNDYGFIPKNSILRSFYYEKTNADGTKSFHTKTPHVLKDGADSVGGLGALNRVYINIGLFSEEWMLHFIPLLGGPKITPIPIETAEKNSTYWRATEEQTPDLALFFLAATPPDKLDVAAKHDPSPSPYVYTPNQPLVDRGKVVFADRCARCHSSKLPARALTDFFQPGCVGPKYLKCWNDYWRWTKTAEFKQQMLQEVMKPDFLENNAMTNDVRVPVTLLETNCCSPLATNAIKNDIWDNFSSKSYKELEPVGKVSVQDPYTGKMSELDLAGGGRGYTRPPSLVSIWSTAPFLQNNSLGPFMWSGSVSDRMTSFNVSIHQLLWPQTRDGEEIVHTKSGLVHPGQIYRLPEKTYVMTYPGYLPGFAQGLPKVLARPLPNVFGTDDNGNHIVKLGPFPKGTPVSLISNVNLQSSIWDLLGFAAGFQRYLEAVNPNDSDEVTAKKFAPLVPRLLKMSKCPDFIVNRGHYFGTQYLPASEGEPGLSDDDKNALIEYLKTF